MTSAKPFNWGTVGADHVRRACELVRSGQRSPRSKAKGLFLSYEGQDLPANMFSAGVLLANNSPDSDLRFASGEA